MTLVRIVKDWDFPDLLRQTPGHSGEWGGVRFTMDAVKECDYVIAFNRIPEEEVVTCPPEHIWVLTQEPPVPEYHWLRQGFDSFHRVYTQDISLQGGPYVHAQPSTPWHVDKDYDFLKSFPVPEKPKILSTMTSAAASRAGHRKRLHFLRTLRKQVDYDWVRSPDYVKRRAPDRPLEEIRRELVADGYTCVESKWDAHERYRYSLVFENHSGPYYWTEKLMDCYLGWAMPIYYGCTNIDEYFPPESMLKIDIDRPEEAAEIIREAVGSELWRERRDAIAHARELILEKHQLFPFLTGLIQDCESTQPVTPRRRNRLPELPFLGHRATPPRRSLVRRAASKAKRLVKRLLP
ncbi:MAG: glycosyltransferase family 10 [bacterium]